MTDNGADADDSKSFFRRKSLHMRVTGAVMLPLTILVIILVSVTAWTRYAANVDTVNRVLVGSVRTLSLAYDSPPELRDQLIPMTVHLLERRARPVVHYSVYEGNRLVSGDRNLPLPDDVHIHSKGKRDLHPPATFSRNIRSTPMTRGYINPRDADNVIQAAYLRSDTMHGRPVVVATEVRRLKENNRIVTIQIADYVDDRLAYGRAYFANLATGGIIILVVATIFMWWAVTWGLQPFSTLTRQIVAARNDPSTSFRLKVQRDAPEEILPFVTSFNALMERLEKAGTSLRQFTSNASHQMRTPLSVARIHLDLLKQAGTNEAAARAAIHDIGNAVESLERLLQQLIVLARADEQSNNPFRSFNLATIVAIVTAEHAKILQEDSVEVFFDNKNAPLALGNAELCAELVGNLVDNAIRHNHTGDNVWVTVHQDDKGWPCVTIADDGPGISETERDLVWERFYRGRKSAATNGSGLGLSIVRELANTLQAKINTSTGPDGKGLSVMVTFQPA